MAPAPKEMRRLLGKTQYVMIDSACQRLSLCALKLHDRGRLTDGGLRLALGVTRRVRQLLPPASLYWFALPKTLPPLRLPLGSESKLESDHPTLGPSGAQSALSLLLDWKPIDAVAGPIKGGSFPAPVNAAGILDVVASAETLAELVPALSGVSQACVELRSRFGAIKRIAEANLLVVGLLHTCFASGPYAPMPLPHEAQGSTDASSESDVSSPCIRGKVTAQLQEQLLTVLIDLGCELASATKSLPVMQTTDALDKICLASMVAIMDAVVMREVSMDTFGADAGEDEKAGGVPRSMLFQGDYGKLGLWARVNQSTSFADTIASTPVLVPGALRVRADLQHYFDAAENRQLGSKGEHFCHWPHEDDAENVACFRITVDKPDTTAEVFINVARRLGYDPVLEDAEFTAPESFTEENMSTFATQNGVPIPPRGVDEPGAKDLADEIVRRKLIYATNEQTGVGYTGYPDKGVVDPAVDSFIIRSGWMMGSWKGPNISNFQFYSCRKTRFRALSIFSHEF